jgi:hypothetical protein
MAIDVQWQPLLDDGSNLAERSSIDSSTMYLESIQMLQQNHIASQMNVT